MVFSTYRVHSLIQSRVYIKIGLFLIQVDIAINDQHVEHLQMKLGSQGEAFFVVDIGEEESIPPRMITSPLPSRPSTPRMMNLEQENEWWVNTTPFQRVFDLTVAQFHFLGFPLLFAFLDRFGKMKYIYIYGTSQIRFCQINQEIVKSHTKPWS